MRSSESLSRTSEVALFFEKSNSLFAGWDGRAARLGGAGDRWVPNGRCRGSGACSSSRMLPLFFLRFQADVHARIAAVEDSAQRVYVVRLEDRRRATQGPVVVASVDAVGSVEAFFMSRRIGRSRSPQKVGAGEATERAMKRQCR